jgi:microsomal dipeptidase-like Zn-dependent dipeptidase
MIQRMEEKRMIVDLAHASPQTIDDVLAMASRHVIVSHTGMCDHNYAFVVSFYSDRIVA